MQEMWVRSLGQEDPLEEEMATHYRILAWGISWTEESVGLQSMRLQRVKHNLMSKQQQWAERGLEIGEAERRRWKNLGNKYLILSLLPVSKLLSQLESCRAQAYISSGSFSWALRSTRKGWEWPWRNKQSIIIRSIYDVLNVVLDTLTKIISFKNGTEIP